jgi:hypothetical protein
MRKKFLVIALIGFFCVLVGIGYYCINLRDIKSIHIDEEDEKLALQEVSRRTGIEFDDWTSLREYIFCDLLKKGMTKDDVEDNLSNIGEIRVLDDSVEFTSRYLDRNISTIVVYYDVGGPTGKLYFLGRRTPSNSDAPTAGCEIQG